MRSNAFDSLIRLRKSIDQNLIAFINIYILIYK